MDSHDLASWIIGAPHVILKIYEVYLYTIQLNIGNRGRLHIFLELHGERLLSSLPDRGYPWRDCLN